MIKVAGYCRVSTDKEDQTNSFVSQQRFFREYIARNPDWVLYEIYADEGVTGTSTKKRAQFHRMIDDGYCGKFQLILTKEVSRFSRNILDTISYTRELKALGIGVIFMTDGFCSLDADAELRLSIMGSIAQEESRKTSSRVKWGQTRQMERGVVFGTSLLGYDVKNGNMTVNREGAEIVRQIFHKYGIEGKGTTAIARELREMGYQTRTGKSEWSPGYILKILKNEKYVGDLIQKKTITPDYLTHQKQYNRGQEERIIHRNHHAPIVTRELWEQVQAEIRRRDRHNGNSAGHSGQYLFSGKIICGQCGRCFISRCKVRPDGTSYRRWSCSTSVKSGKKGCTVGRHIRDELARDMLMDAYRRLPIDFNRIIQDTAAIAAKSVSAGPSPKEQADLVMTQIQQINKQKDAAVDAYLSHTLSREEWIQAKKRYDIRIQTLQAKLDTLQTGQADSFRQGYDTLYSRVRAIILGEEFSEVYFRNILDQMTVYESGTVALKIKEYSAFNRYQLTHEKKHDP